MTEKSAGTRAARCDDDGTLHDNAIDHGYPHVDTHHV